MKNILEITDEELVKIAQICCPEGGDFKSKSFFRKLDSEFNIMRTDKDVTIFYGWCDNNFIEINQRGVVSAKGVDYGDAGTSPEVDIEANTFLATLEVIKLGYYIQGCENIEVKK